VGHRTKTGPPLATRSVDLSQGPVRKTRNYLAYLACRNPYRHGLQLLKAALVLQRSGRFFALLGEAREPPTEAASIQVTTEFLDNLPHVVRVLFDQSPCLLHAWRFWLWRFFASVLLAGLAHEPDGPSLG
jgi:hypothetical protein